MLIYIIWVNGLKGLVILFLVGSVVVLVVLSSYVFGCSEFCEMIMFCMSIWYCLFVMLLV